LRRRKIRTKRLELGAAVAAAFCLGGCGGSGARDTAPPPTLPRTLASALATRSDAIADALAGRDTCHAAQLADELQHETIAAINERRVPPLLQESLSATVNDLVARVNCVPPPQPPTKEKDEHGKHKGKKKHKEGD
jgi:hypothetical protein